MGTTIIPAVLFVSVSLVSAGFANGERQSSKTEAPQTQAPAPVQEEVANATGIVVERDPLLEEMLSEFISEEIKESKGQQDSVAVAKKP